MKLFLSFICLFISQNSIADGEFRSHPFWYLNSKFSIGLPETPVFLKKKVKIASLDWGVDFNENELSHFIKKENLAQNKLNIIEPNKIDVPDEDNLTNHGTHTAGLIAIALLNLKIAEHQKISDFFEILPIKVQGEAIDKTDSSTAKLIIAGLEKAEELGADIITLSISPEHSEMDSLLEATVARLIANGKIIVAAAGNENSNFVNLICLQKSVICVGAINEFGQKYSNSNFGPNVEIFAPGENIFSISRSDRAMTSGKYHSLSGTSEAAPLVAVSLAVLASLYPEESHSDLQARLYLSGQIYPSLIQLSQFGLLNLNAAINAQKKSIVRAEVKTNEIFGNGSLFQIPFKFHCVGKNCGPISLRVSIQQGINKVLDVQKDNLKFSEGQISINFAIQLDPEMTSQIKYQLSWTYEKQEKFMEGFATAVNNTSFEKMPLLLPQLYKVSSKTKSFSVISDRDEFKKFLWLNVSKTSKEVLLFSPLQKLQKKLYLPNLVDIYQVFERDFDHDQKMDLIVWGKREKNSSDVGLKNQEQECLWVLSNFNFSEETNVRQIDLSYPYVGEKTTISAFSKELIKWRTISYLGKLYDVPVIISEAPVQLSEMIYEKLPTALSEVINRPLNYIRRQIFSFNYENDGKLQFKLLSNIEMVKEIYEQLHLDPKDDIRFLFPLNQSSDDLKYLISIQRMDKLGATYYENAVVTLLNFTQQSVVTNFLSFPFPIHTQSKMTSWSIASASLEKIEDFAISRRISPSLFEIFAILHNRIFHFNILDQEKLVRLIALELENEQLHVVTSHESGLKLWTVDGTDSNANLIDSKKVVLPPGKSASVFYRNVTRIKNESLNRISFMIGDSMYGGRRVQKIEILNSKIETHLKTSFYVGPECSLIDTFFDPNKRETSILSCSESNNLLIHH